MKTFTEKMNNYFQQSAESGYFSSNWHLRFAIVQIENRIQEKLFVYALTQNEGIGIKKIQIYVVIQKKVE